MKVRPAVLAIDHAKLGVFHDQEFVQCLSELAGDPRRDAHEQPFRDSKDLEFALDLALLVEGETKRAAPRSHGQDVTGYQAVEPTSGLGPGYGQRPARGL